MPVPVSKPGSAGRLTLAVKSALYAGGRVGVVHYVVAIFSIQGVAYLTQLLIARAVGPADFAVVRTVEATLNVLLVAASFGMPMLAVTTVAGLADEKEQGRMLGSLVALAVLGGLATAAIASVAAGVLAPTPARYFRMMAWIMPLSAASRTCLNYFQGRQQVQRVAGYTVALSLISLAVVIVAVTTAGLAGWVVGRYLTEVLFLALLVWAVGPSLSLDGVIPGGHGLRSLLRAGSGIAASLLIRTAMDNVGLYLLVFASAPAAIVGYFGLSSLVLLALTIVPTSLASIALPRIVARIGDPAAVQGFVRRVGGGTVLLALLLSGTTALLAKPAVDLFFPSYGAAVPILLILLAAVPLRAVSVISGVVLIACDRVGMTVWANLLALAVTVLVGAAATSWWGAAGAAAAVVVGEIVGAGVYAVAARVVLPRASRESMREIEDQMSERSARPTRRLNVGCGHDVRAGWVNLDAAPLPGVDVVHDLSKLPWPFPADRFDEIIMINVLEHLEDTVRNMEELHRISAARARLTIRVPYWNSPAAASDPTHRSIFNEETFDFFDPTTRHGRERGYYSAAKFRILKKSYFTFVSERLPNPRVTSAPSKWILKRLARHLGGVIWAIEVELEVLKT